MSECEAEKKAGADGEIRQLSERTASAEEISLPPTAYPSFPFLREIYLHLTAQLPHHLSRSETTPAFKGEEFVSSLLQAHTGRCIPSYSLLKLYFVFNVCTPSFISVAHIVAGDGIIRDRLA